jgi:hypothetical protein
VRMHFSHHLVNNYGANKCTQVIMRGDTLFAFFAPYGPPAGGWRAGPRGRGELFSCDFLRSVAGSK